MFDIPFLPLSTTILCVVCYYYTFLVSLSTIQNASNYRARLCIQRNRNFGTITTAITEVINTPFTLHELLMTSHYLELEPKLTSI